MRAPPALYRRYLDEFERISKLAYQNLTHQEMYWAEVDGGKVAREHVESALITWARRQDPMTVQNGAVSRMADRETTILILSTFAEEPPRELPLDLRPPP